MGRRAQWRDESGAVEMMPSFTWNDRSSVPRNKERQADHLSMDRVCTEEHRCYFGSRNYHDLCFQHMTGPRNLFHSSLRG